MDAARSKLDIARRRRRHSFKTGQRNNSASPRDWVIPKKNRGPIFSVVTAAASLFYGRGLVWLRQTKKFLPAWTVNAIVLVTLHNLLCNYSYGTFARIGSQFTERNYFSCPGKRNSVSPVTTRVTHALVKCDNTAHKTDISSVVVIKNCSPRFLEPNMDQNGKCRQSDWWELSNFNNRQQFPTMLISLCYYFWNGPWCSLLASSAQIAASCIFQGIMISNWQFHDVVSIHGVCFLL